MFVNNTSGSLVDVTAPDGSPGKAFVPAPLPDDMPALSASTILAVAEARAALAALDTTSAQLPDPTLLRAPTLRREAQATSEPATLDLVEILNYERMANYGFGWVGDGRPITTAFLEDLHGILMRGTPLAGGSGRLRDTQVVIGKRAGGAAHSNPLAAARFVPSPPGDHLKDGLDGLVGWMRQDHRARVDPVVATAMSHYQLETLHPAIGVLTEPTLTVSSWFEARRTDYYDHLLAVSTRGDWDPFIGFFAAGLRAVPWLIWPSRIHRSPCVRSKRGWVSPTGVRTH